MAETCRQVFFFVKRGFVASKTSIALEFGTALSSVMMPEDSCAGNASPAVLQQPDSRNAVGGYQGGLHTCRSPVPGPGAVGPLPARLCRLFCQLALTPAAGTTPQNCSSAAGGPAFTLGSW